MADIQKKNICFLVLPGFSLDNTSMRDITQALEALDYPVFSVNFWGNNEQRDFSKLTMEECRVGVAEEINKLSESYEHIVGIGMSLGGALLLDYAKHNDKLYCIVGVGIPFKLKYELFIRFGLFFLPIARLYYRITPRKFKWVASGKVVRYLTRDFVQDIDRVRTRVLLLHTTTDFVADRAVVDEFLNMMASTKKQVVYMKNPDHIMDCDSKIILPALSNFLNSYDDSLNIIS